MTSYCETPFPLFMCAKVQKKDETFGCFNRNYYFCNEIILRVVRGDSYRYDLDLLKGLAIIAVVLYHAGWCKSGYLGVDLFLVLNGYLVVPQVMRQIDERRFTYWAKKTKRPTMPTIWNA